MSRIVRLCGERPALLRQFEGQHLANLLWGLCRAGFRPHPAFLQHVAKVLDTAAGCCCRHRSCCPGCSVLCCKPLLLLLLNCAPACTTASTLYLPLQEAQLRVADLKPQELFNIAWSYSQLGHHPGPLLDAIAAEVVPRAFAFSPQELSGTLWALAKARHSTRSTRALLDVS